MADSLAVAAAALGGAVSTLPTPGPAVTRFFEGEAGRIETVISVPPKPPIGVALVCHPHPLHGGALSNKVTYTVASAALKLGFVAARFNFRGVGKSEGVHDEGRGETADTLVVAAGLRQLWPDLPLLLAGFSFGAFVSLKAAAAARPALQISVAPPFKYFAADPLPERPQAPWLVVHAKDDDVVDFEETRQSLEHYRPSPEMAVLDSAGHFFHGKLGELQSICTEFIQTNWPRSLP